MAIICRSFFASFLLCSIASSIAFFASLCVLLFSSTRASSASKFAGSLSSVYTGAATCWAICAWVGDGDVDAGGVCARAPALLFEFHAFSLRTGLEFTFLVFRCRRFGRVWYLLMLATSAGEFAGKTDRRCALFFFSVAGFGETALLPDGFLLLWVLGFLNNLGGESVFDSFVKRTNKFFHNGSLIFIIS